MGLESLLEKTKKGLKKLAYAGAVGLALLATPRASDAAVGKFWREDFTTGINQSYEAWEQRVGIVDGRPTLLDPQPSNQWSVNNGFLEAQDFDNEGSGRLMFFFTDNTYARQENYTITTIVSRDIWNSDAADIGVVINAISPEDFYVFKMSASPLSVPTPQWGFHHFSDIPGEAQTFNHGLTNLLSTTSPNKLTAKISPTETQFYINDQFLTSESPIKEGYSGYVGLYAFDSRRGEGPQTTAFFDYIEITPEPSALSLFSAGLTSLLGYNRRKNGI